MTSARAHAYTRVIRTLDDYGPAKLQGTEQERIRSAADALLFCTDFVRDPEAKIAVSDVLALHDHLVGSGRWTPERASELADDLWACGPGLGESPAEPVVPGSEDAALGLAL